MAEMNVEQIQALLPHRYPFLLVDRVLETKPGQWIKGIKNVTINEPFFNGHFPGLPIMPGVLIMEALAQVSGLLAFSASDQPENKLALFAGIDKARFKRQVVPGDQLVLEATYVTQKLGLWVFQCKATVEGKVAALGEIKIATADRE